MKFNKSVNIFLFVCIFTSENNNKQYLVSYFYKHIAFLTVFFIKELTHPIIIHTFFDKTGNTGKTMQQQHFNQYIYIYLQIE